MDNELCIVHIFLKGLLPCGKVLFLPVLTVFLRQYMLPGVAHRVGEIVLQRVHGAVGVVMDTHACIGIVIVALAAESFRYSELIPFPKVYF